MFQILVTSDALQLVGDNLFHLLLDAPVIRLHHFLHAVVAVRVREVGNDGYRLVGFLLALHFLGIHDNLTVENLLLDTLVEVVGHRTDTGGQDEKSKADRLTLVKELCKIAP